MSCLFCSWCPSGRNNILHRESELLHMAQCKWFNWFKRKHFSLLSSLPAVFLFRPLVVCLFGFLSALAAVLFSGARGGSQPLRICWTTNFIAVWWGGKHFRWFEHNVRYGTYYIYKQDRGLVGVLLTSGVLQCHLGIAELAEEWGLPVEARSQDSTLWICEVKTIPSHLWVHLLGKFQDPRPQMDLSWFAMSVTTIMNSTVPKNEHI